jgi:hypothetical protein
MENAATTILQSVIYHSVMMGSSNGVHRAFAVKAYFKNNDSYVTAKCVFWNNFNIRHNDLVPSAHAIKNGLRTSMKRVVH